LIFCPEEEHLPTMGFQKGVSINIWNDATNKPIHEFVNGCSSGLEMGDDYPMVFHPDGKYFAFEQQGQLCLYDAQNWQGKWCVLSGPEDYRVK